MKGAYLFQLKLMDLSDGLELVQRLSGERPTKYGTARVWRNSIKAAELVAQYLVTAGMVRPVPETGANILEQILNSWALLHSKLKDVAPTLPGMIRKLIEPAESAQHIYIFCAVLVKHVSIHIYLYICIYIVFFLSTCFVLIALNATWLAQNVDTNLLLYQVNYFAFNGVLLFLLTD